MKNVCLFLLVCVSLMGCATSFYKDASAGQIGCDPEAIEIGDVRSSLRTQTWPASCHGHKFMCSSVSSGGMGSNQVTCKPAI